MTFSDNCFSRTTNPKVASSILAARMIKINKLQIITLQVKIILLTYCRLTKGINNKTHRSRALENGIFKGSPVNEPPRTDAK
jgi:hypothetical protein